MVIILSGVDLKIEEIMKLNGSFHCEDEFEDFTSDMEFYDIVEHIIEVDNRDRQAESE